jgi:hypothetical protein
MNGKHPLPRLARRASDLGNGYHWIRHCDFLVQVLSPEFRELLHRFNGIVKGEFSRTVNTVFVCPEDVIHMKRVPCELEDSIHGNKSSFGRDLEGAIYFTSRSPHRLACA